MGEIQNDTVIPRAGDIVLMLGDAKPATADGDLISARHRRLGGSVWHDSLGCAAYMAWEYRVLRGDLRRRPARAGPGLRREPLELGRVDGPAPGARGGSLGRRLDTGRARDRARDHRAGHGPGRRRAACRARRTGRLDVGTPAHRDVQGGDDRHRQRHRPAGVVLQRRSRGGRRRCRRRRQHLLPVQARRTRTRTTPPPRSPASTRCSASPTCRHTA